MAVFTLEQLQKLPQDAFFFAVVDRMSEQNQESTVEFSNIMHQIDEKEQEYLQLLPTVKEEIQRIFDQKRKDVFLKFYVEATILYRVDSNTYIDLLYNDYLKKEDYVFEDYLFPVKEYLEDEPLQFRESFQMFPFEKQARVDDKRFSYYREDLEEYVPGPFLIEYYTNWEKNNGSTTSSFLENIINRNENSFVETVTVTRKLDHCFPYLSAFQLERINFNEVYCAIIEYKEPYVAIKMGEEIASLRMQEEALKQASIDATQSKQRFLKYKKRRESHYETTNRATFDFKKEMWQEKEQKYLSLKALENSFLENCHCCSTLVYETEDGLIDLYANQLLNEEEVIVRKETMTPVSAYCNPDSIKIRMKRDFFDTYITLTEPIVVLQDGTIRKTGPLLDAFGQFFYAKEYRAEREQFSKKKRMKN